MKRQVILFSFLFLFFVPTFAQKNIVVSIGDKKITKEDYENVYRKNNTQLNDENDVKTPTEYLELFIDYKLKVIEAENRGLDTLSTFINELAGYREELAKPYLTDVTLTDSMVKEAYYRTINEIRASHILLQIPTNATPEDTLVIYNKLIDIRNQFLNKEKSFEELAKLYSEDPSAQYNNGDLGFFKAFSMDTRFENVAYNTPIGEVSLPFSTRYGYHIVYATDLIEASEEVKVAHIMKMFKDRNNVSEQEEQALKAGLDSLHNLIKNGADFGILAADNSDDRGTSLNNGEMRWITKSFNVTEFSDVVFSMKKDGEIAGPIRTPFGYHLIKRIGTREPLSLDEMRDELTQKIKKDPVRSSHNKESFINKKKQQNNFIAYEENIEYFRNYINGLENDTLPEVFPIDIQSLKFYKVGNKVYDFNNFYELQKEKKQNDSKFQRKYFMQNFDIYDETVLTEYESEKLNQNPEFSQIMEEYHDGMLLFSIMEEEVWNKAVQDTLGLLNYYERNKGKYLWDKHFEGLLIQCYNQNALDSCKLFISQGIVDADSLKKRINGETPSSIKITKGKWEIGSNEKVDFLVFGAKRPLKFDVNLEFVHGDIFEAGTPKTLDESRGHYISDYQKELENEWIQSLRKKYKIKVNKKLLKKVESL